MSNPTLAECRAYSPNRLFDHLLQQLRLPTDEALARVLDVEPVLIHKIRHGQLAIGSSLLIRISEVSDKSVRELRHLMGDRRIQYRLNDMQFKRKLKETDEAGLPNSVQWA